AVSFFWFSNLTTDVSIDVLFTIRCFQGIALTLFFIPLVQLSLAYIPQDRYTNAAGLFNFIRILIGGGFGTSLSIEIWTRLEIFHHSRLTESTTIYNSVTNQFYIDMQNKNFPKDVIDRILDTGVEQQAYMLSTNDLFYLAMWLFIAMIPIPYLCKRIPTIKKGTDHVVVEG